MSKGLGAAARFPREQRERSSGTASAGRAGSPRAGDAASVRLPVSPCAAGEGERGVFLSGEGSCTQKAKLEGRDGLSEPSLPSLWCWLCALPGPACRQ